MVPANHSLALTGADAFSVQIQRGELGQRKHALGCRAVGFCDNYIKLEYVFNRPQTKLDPGEIPRIGFKAANSLNISFCRQHQVDF